MRNGLGLSGNQLERYQTQRSIVIKKQADLVNCSALGSLAIEKGFETTVDKLLKELLKKAAGAVGGALGGAAAISGGIVIGMLLSTEEVGESKEELDELEREQEKKKDNEDRNDSGGSKKKKPKQDKEGDSETNAPKNETPINQGNSKPPQKSTPNSVYEQLNPDGTVRVEPFMIKMAISLTDRILTISILIKIHNRIYNPMKIIISTMMMDCLMEIQQVP